MSKEYAPYWNMDSIFDVACKYCKFLVGHQIKKTTCYSKRNKSETHFINYLDVTFLSYISNVSIFHYYDNLMILGVSTHWTLHNIFHNGCHDRNLCTFMNQISYYDNDYRNDMMANIGIKHLFEINCRILTL